MAGIPGCVGGHGWCHTSPHGQQGEDGSTRRCPQLYCSFVQYTSKKVDEGMRRKYAGYTTLPPPSLCVIRYPHGGGGKIAFVFPIRLGCGGGGSGVVEHAAAGALGHTHCSMTHSHTRAVSMRW